MRPTLQGKVPGVKSGLTLHVESQISGPQPSSTVAMLVNGGHHVHLTGSVVLLHSLTTVITYLGASWTSVNMIYEPARWCDTVEATTQAGIYRLPAALTLPMPYMPDHRLRGKVTTL